MSTDIRIPDDVFSPGTVAVFGASADPRSLRAVVARNSAAWRGTSRVVMVNPTNDEHETDGVAWVRELDGTAKVDVAVVAVGRDAALAATDSAISAGVRVVAMLGAGYAELDDEGVALQNELRARCDDAGACLFGPNFNGIANLSHHFGFGTVPGIFQLPIEPGTTTRPVMLISQSGALAGAVFEQAYERGLRPEYVVSTGNEAQQDVADWIGWATRNTELRTVMLVLETVRDPQALLSSLQAARQRGIDVVASCVAADRDELARSHTGALAGSALGVRTVLQAAGVPVVSLRDLPTAACETSARGDRRATNIVAVATSGGLAGDFARAITRSDLCTLAPLDSPPFGLPGLNPLDVTGIVASSPEKWRTLLQHIGRTTDADLYVLLLTRLADTIEDEMAEIALSVLPPERIRVVWVNAWSYGGGWRRYADAGVPIYPDSASLIEALDVCAPPPRQGVSLMASTPASDAGIDLPIVRAAVTDSGFLVPAEVVIDDDAQLLAAWKKWQRALILKVVQSSYGHAAVEGRIRSGAATWDELCADYRDLARRFPQQAHTGGLIAQQRVLYGAEIFVSLQWLPALGQPLMVIGPSSTVAADSSAYHLLPWPCGSDVLLSAVDAVLARDSHRGSRQGRAQRVAESIAAFGTRVACLLRPGDLVELSPLLDDGVDTWAVDIKLQLQAAEPVDVTARIA